MSRWTVHIEKIADLHCDLWHWFKGWFFEEFHIWRQACHHWKQLFEEKNSAALKAFCTSVFSCTYFAEILYWANIHSCNQYLSCWIVDCPPSFEEQILYFENSLESFVFVESHCKRVHFRLKPTPFHFLSLSC